MKCVEVYKELYHQEPFDVAFCPYRISPLGAHIDHQYGKINGLAIDKGIHMAYHPKQNGVVELQSLNFPKRAQFFVNAVPEEKQGDWADHLRGAAKMLGEKYRLKVGLSGIIEGSLPIGGLSSSASVIICFLSALCKVNGIHLEPMEMILTAKAAENQYVGVACGKLDQSCEVLSKKNHLLYLDTKDDSYELIPTSEKMKPYKVAIFFSGLERSLKNSKYNLRQDECKAAAYALMGYAGMDYDTFANTRLRDVPYEVFEAYLRDPAIVIRKDSITFNTACITGLEDVVYVHVMFNNDLKRIVVRGCDENDKDALRWCVAKPDKRKSRKMSCKPFATLVYQKMGWDSECRYKMLGYRITFEGETLYVFDLLVPEIFHEGQRKKNAVDSQDNAASTKPVNSRKGFYLDDIVGTFGVPVEEHRKESEVKQMDGYVSMGILTGKIAPEAGKD